MVGLIGAGFLTAAGLIIAIGVQNTYVFKQGLTRNHIGWVCTICVLGDALLMSTGILGLGSISGNSKVIAALTVTGAIFCFCYGFWALRSAWQGNTFLSMERSPSNRGFATTISGAIAVTFLNPHVYLDTLVILGGIANALGTTERGWFLCGALAASIAWFFGLGYGSIKLRPILTSPRFFQVVDTAIGILMLGIALSLSLKFIPA